MESNHGIIEITNSSDESRLPASSSSSSNHEKSKHKIISMRMEKLLKIDSPFIASQLSLFTQNGWQQRAKEKLFAIEIN